MTIIINEQICQTVNDIVNHYSKYDPSIESYAVDMAKVSPYDLGALASLILSLNEDLASEACGPDNPEYDRTMLPALHKCLRGTIDAIDFQEIWGEGVTDYLRPHIARLLSIELESLNEERKCTTTLKIDPKTNLVTEVGHRYS